jgi:hypothetical protein
MPSITLSSAGTATLLTDYIGAKATTIGVTFSSSTSSAAYQVQVTLDTSAASGVSPTWFLASSVTFASSTNFDTPTALQYLSPIAGVRINSTGLSSGSITLRVLQNAGG